MRAEILKLRKRRGLVSLTALLTLGAIVVTYGVLAVLHAANPAHHGPAGGVANLSHGMIVLATFGSVAATIAGATAGAGDLGAGVFRELVVTGRSRRALFYARVPGGLVFVFPFLAAAYGLAALASVFFAGSLAAPSPTLLAESGAWVVLLVSFYYVVALGLASLVGSRSTTIGVVLAWRLALAPVLLAIGFLGVTREAVPTAALQRLLPRAVVSVVRQGDDVSMSVAAAITTLVLWSAAALALGSWRTRTRDA